MPDPHAPLNALLAQVRACRAALLAPEGQTFDRALSEPLLRHLRALESVLVLFGAGTEDDAELGMDLIPQPDALPPGPSVDAPAGRLVGAERG
jgi:hypothetical protein